MNVKIGGDREKRTRDTIRMASIVIMTAVTVVFTYAVRIPVAPTRGYLNLGDVAIYFTAFAFGPWTALITGGVGTALADILGGYSQWAPITFFAHGLQGFAVGFLFYRFAGEEPRLEGGGFFFALGMAFVLGTVVMAGIYFFAGSLMMGIGPALVELPGNVLQNLAGILVGTFLWAAVSRAYPPIFRHRW